MRKETFVCFYLAALHYILFLIIIYTMPYVNFILIVNRIFKQRTIYVAIMTGAARSKLLEKLYYIWIKEFMTKSYCSVVKLYGVGEIYTDNSAIKNMYIDTQIIPNDISRNHLCGKFIIAINDFLTNSSAHWFLRLCDDTFINMKSFSLFYSELNQNTDPTHDKLVQGNCLHKGKKTYAYIQGGSGIILSRYSAIEFNKSFDHFSKVCHYVKSDDTTIGIWLRDNNYTFRSMANRFFVGHQFRGFHKIIDLNNRSQIIKCPEVFPKNTRQVCRAFVTKLKNVAFWHDRAHFMNFLPYARDFVSNLTDNLYFYQEDVLPRVCYGSNITEGYLE